MNDQNHEGADQGYLGGPSILTMAVVGVMVLGMYTVAASSNISYYAILAVVGSASFLTARAFRKENHTDQHHG